MNKKLKDISWEELNDLFSPEQMKLQGSRNGGRTAGRMNAENGIVNKAGRISATKQWKENRDGGLKKSSMGGTKAVKTKVGIHNLSKKELSNAGKKGHANGLGKLSKKEKMKIIIKASMASRDVNSKLNKKIVLFMRKNFIPRHTKFGVVAFAKKYDTTEQAIRNAIKGRTFKEI
jgi:hypothetical protein